MGEITLIERDMTADELQWMNEGFDEYTREAGAAIQDSVRITYVAMDGDRYRGTVSGLAYYHAGTFSGWFYLTDLYVVKAYRNMGTGAKLLAALEHRLYGLGIDKIWTWTAGYEAPEFYKKYGYSVFTEMEDWYSTGESRIGLRKQLTQPIK